MEPPVPHKQMLITLTECILHYMNVKFVKSGIESMKQKEFNKLLEFYVPLLTQEGYNVEKEHGKLVLNTMFEWFEKYGAD